MTKSGKHRGKRIGLLLFIAVSLCGCYRSSTIVLPPETAMDSLSVPSVAETFGDTTSVNPSESWESLPSTEATVPPESSEPEPIPETTAAPADPTLATVAPKPSVPPVPTEATAPPETTPPPETTAPPETAPPPETTGPTQPDVYDISRHSVGDLEYAILDEINAQRAAAGVSPLTMDTTLCALSAIRAYEASEFWSHTRPNGSDCFSVLEEYGYTGWNTAGENLLGCTTGYSAADMVAAWMDSDGHRANILNSAFTHAGIGIFESGGWIYIANFFVGK